MTLVITSHQPILCLCNEYDCPRNDGRGSTTGSHEANIYIPRGAEITEISQISVIQPNAMWRPADADDTQFLRNAIIRNVLFVWNRWQQQMGPGQTCKRGLTMFGMESTILGGTPGGTIGVPGAFFRGGQQFLSAKTQFCSAKKISSQGGPNFPILFCQADLPFFSVTLFCQS